MGYDIRKHQINGKALSTWKKVSIKGLKDPPMIKSVTLWERQKNNLKEP